MASHAQRLSVVLVKFAGNLKITRSRSRKERNGGNKIFLMEDVPGASFRGQNSQTTCIDGNFRTGIFITFKN